MKRYLDPKNIASKHQTSEGIWKPRVIGAPPSPFITGFWVHLVDVMVSFFFSAQVSGEDERDEAGPMVFKHYLQYLFRVVA